MADKEIEVTIALTPDEAYAIHHLLWVGMHSMSGDIEGTRESAKEVVKTFTKMKESTVIGFAEKINKIFDPFITEEFLNNLDKK